MPSLARIHHQQHLRHVTANKLTLPLTVLRRLAVGEPVPPRLLQQAIRDLEAIRDSMTRTD